MGIGRVTAPSLFTFPNAVPHSAVTEHPFRAGHRAWGFRASLGARLVGPVCEAAGP